MKFQARWRKYAIKMLGSDLGQEYAAKLQYIVENLPPNEHDVEKVGFAIATLCQNVAAQDELLESPSLINLTTDFCEALGKSVQETATIHLYVMTTSIMAAKHSPLSVEEVAGELGAVRPVRPLDELLIASTADAPIPSVQTIFGQMLIEMGQHNIEPEHYFQMLQAQYDRYQQDKNISPAFWQKFKQASIKIISEPPLMSGELAKVAIALTMPKQMFTILMVASGAIGTLNYACSKTGKNSPKDPTRTNCELIGQLVGTFTHNAFEILECFKLGAIYYSGFLESIGRLVVFTTHIESIAKIIEQADALEATIDETPSIMLPLITAIMVLTTIYLSVESYHERHKLEPDVLQKEIEAMASEVLIRLSHLKPENKEHYLYASIADTYEELTARITPCWEDAISQAHEHNNPRRRSEVQIEVIDSEEERKQAPAQPQDSLVQYRQRKTVKHDEALQAMQLRVQALESERQQQQALQLKLEERLTTATRYNHTYQARIHETQSQAQANEKALKGQIVQLNAELINRPALPPRQPRARRYSF